MNNYSYLTIDFNQFKAKINSLITESSQITEDVPTDENAYQKTENAYQNWQSDVVNTLQESFADKRNSFIIEFKQSVRQKYSFSNIPQSFPVSKLFSDLKEDLLLQVEYLRYNLKFIDACDKISKPKEDYSKREKYTVNEKLNLILEKLHFLNDGNEHSIEDLLIYNGIKLTNYYEPRELIAYLENNGYVDSNGGIGTGISARITTTGVMYLESNYMHKEDYENIPSQNIVDNRIDEIIDALKKQGMGQEILFEELQELKELYGKINKKNWGQLVKGKLIDLALGKIVENDTIKFIYENITGNELKLIN